MKYLRRWPLLSRRSDGEPLYRKLAARARKHHRRRRGCRGDLADLTQARDALARGHKLLPGAKRYLDRRQRAAHHDRGCDHDAARGSICHHEIGADAQHAGLQYIAQYLRARSQIGIYVGGADILAQIALIGPRPARCESIRHAERPDYFGIALGRWPPGPAVGRWNPSRPWLPLATSAPSARSWQ